MLSLLFLSVGRIKQSSSFFPVQPQEDSSSVEVEVEEVDEFDILDVEIDIDDGLDDINQQDEAERSTPVSTTEENSNRSIDDELEIEIDNLSPELDDLMVETTNVTQDEPVKTEQKKQR